MGLSSLSIVAFVPPKTSMRKVLQKQEENAWERIIIVGEYTHTGAVNLSTMPTPIATIDTVYH